jgi:hypothetical protein
MTCGAVLGEDGARKRRSPASTATNQAGFAWAPSRPRNFARVALRVQQSVDSRVILDENGAEALLGRGDLLFKSAEMGLVRLQGYAASGPYSF